MESIDFVNRFELTENNTDAFDVNSGCRTIQYISVSFFFVND